MKLKGGKRESAMSGLGTKFGMPCATTVRYSPPLLVDIIL